MISNLSESAGEQVAAFKSQLAEADALLIASPEHNFSLTASLKNALDWGSRGPRNFWKDKPTGVCAVGGSGAIQSQMELRKVAVFLELRILNRPFLSVSLRNDGGKFDSNGDVTDAGLLAEAGAMVAELQRYTVALRAGGALDSKL